MLEEVRQRDAAIAAAEAKCKNQLDQMAVEVQHMAEKLEQRERELKSSQEEVEAKNSVITKEQYSFSHDISRLEKKLAQQVAMVVQCQLGAVHLSPLAQHAQFCSVLSF